MTLLEMEDNMAKNIGLWIDHEKAFIVSMIEGNEKICKIESNVESHIKTLGGSRSATPYGPQDVSVERKIEARRKQHLRKYYLKLIDEIKDAQNIYIFGPGNAKIEMKKEMKKLKDIAAKILAVEAADKMTEGQIAAKAREFFIAKK
jgi:hypothetical protein